MTAPWEFFEEMNELLYVVDIQNHGLVYMNRRARESFGVERDGYQGKKCYAILQRLPEPCPFCTNARLSEGSFCEWRYHNPIVKGDFLLKDTLVRHEGKRYRVELAIRADGEAAGMPDMNAYIHYESMVNQCLMRANATADAGEALGRMLDYLGEQLGCGVCLYERGRRDQAYHTYA